MKNYPDQLTRVPLFDGVDRGELEELLDCLGARVRTYQKGEMVFREGDPAGIIGVVLSGRVQVVKDDFYGRRSVVAAIGPAQLFGEAFACAGAETLPVSVRADTDVSALLLDGGRITGACAMACSAHGVLVRNLLRIVAGKNLILNQKIEVMSQKTTREKLMAFLSAQAKEAGRDRVAIPFDRQGLADYLGVERSAMSAEIGKLRDLGYLEVRRNEFRLLKPYE